MSNPESRSDNQESAQIFGGMYCIPVRSIPEINLLLGGEKGQQAYREALVQEAARYPEDMNKNLDKIRQSFEKRVFPENDFGSL